MNVDLLRARLRAPTPPPDTALQPARTMGEPPSIGLPLAVGGLFTVSAGVAVAHRLPERTMKAAFAWMILGTAIWLLLKPILLK